MSKPNILTLWSLINKLQILKDLWNPWPALKQYYPWKAVCSKKNNHTINNECHKPTILLWIVNLVTSHQNCPNITCTQNKNDHLTFLSQKWHRAPYTVMEAKICWKCNIIKVVKTTSKTYNDIQNTSKYIMSIYRQAITNAPKCKAWNPNLAWFVYLGKRLGAWTALSRYPGLNNS